MNRSNQFSGTSILAGMKQKMDHYNSLNHQQDIEPGMSPMLILVFSSTMFSMFEQSFHLSVLSTQSIGSNSLLLPGTRPNSDHGV
ncbi:MAG: hypothetical protein ACKVH8_19650 [Pirellulales bacterium]|jgi:hypothetical protein